MVAIPQSAEYIFALTINGVTTTPLFVESINGTALRMETFSFIFQITTNPTTLQLVNQSPVGTGTVFPNNVNGSPTGGTAGFVTIAKLQ